MTKTIIALTLLIGLAHAEKSIYSDKGVSDKPVFNPYYPLAENTTHYDKPSSDNTLSKPYYPVNGTHTGSVTETK